MQHEEQKEEIVEQKEFDFFEAYSNHPLYKVEEKQMDPVEEP